MLKNNVRKDNNKISEIQEDIDTFVDERADSRIATMDIPKQDSLIGDFGSFKKET